MWQVGACGFAGYQCVYIFMPGTHTATSSINHPLMCGITAPSGRGVAQAGEWGISAAKDRRTLYDTCNMDKNPDMI